MKKYVGADVHGQSVTFSVLDEKGRPLQIGATVPTERTALVEFVRGLSGEVHLALEEGTQARWFAGLVRRYVKEVVVCDPRRNRPKGPLRNKNDRLDSERLAELLRLGELTPVYQGDEGLTELREWVRGYQMLTEDGTRIKNRVKAVFRAEGKRASGTSVYGKQHRQEYIGQVGRASTLSHLEALYSELDQVELLMVKARKDMLDEAKRYGAWKLLRTIPGIGPIFSAILVATIGTPHRFPNKQAFWAYCGLAVVHRRSGEYVKGSGGELAYRQLPGQTRGLNRNRNPYMKQVFKSAALVAMQQGEFGDYYHQEVARGLDPAVARVQVARKLATIALTLWKKECRYQKGMLNKETT